MKFLITGCASSVGVAVTRYLITDSKAQVLNLEKPTHNGNPDSVMKDSHFVQMFWSRQGLKIACLEKTGVKQGCLSQDTIRARDQLLGKTCYGQYLLRQA